MAALLAVVVTALLSSRWSRETQLEPPPLLGKIPEFALTNRDGRVVSQADLAGSPWVADIIFTRCALSCPRMTALMIRVGAAMPQESRINRVSFSVDPMHDTPEVLAAYAKAYGIEDPNWLFLTGEPERLYALMVGGFKLSVDPSPPPGQASSQEPILHSNRFALVDGTGVLRGYYDPFRSEELERLLRDLDAVTQEQTVVGAP